MCAEHKGPPVCRARRGRRRANEGVFPRPPGTAGTRGPVFSPKDTAGSRSIPQPTPPEGEHPAESGSAGSGLPERPARPAAPARRDGSGAPGPVEPPVRGGCLALPPHGGPGYRRERLGTSHCPRAPKALSDGGASKRRRNWWQPNRVP